jgi:hypothetical protein
MEMSIDDALLGSDWLGAQTGHHGIDSQFDIVINLVFENDLDCGGLGDANRGIKTGQFITDRFDIARGYDFVIQDIHPAYVRLS